MTAAVIVAVLLNGVQIDMPAPGMLIEGRCWVPLRPMAERLGYQIVLPYDAPPQLVREGREIEVPISQRLEGHTYIPARWLTELGAKVEYDPDRRQLSVTAVLAGPSATGAEAPEGQEKPLLAQILADPAAWADRSVGLEGEFLGWSANPLCPAVSFGPPVTRSDWVLRGNGGCLYCTGTLPFSPTDAMGRRAAVDGVVRLTGDGWPYVEVKEVRPLTGLQGLCCLLTTDGFIYEPGDTVVLKLLVRNDNVTSLDLVFPTSQTYDFTLVDTSGREVWRWSDGRMFTQALVQRTLEAGQGYTVEEKLDLGTIPGLSEDRYTLRGKLPRVTESYAHPVMVKAKE